MQYETDAQAHEDTEQHLLETFIRSAEFAQLSLAEQWRIEAEAEGRSS